MLTGGTAKALLADRRGVVAVLVGLLSTPMIIAVGLSIDYAQMIQSETTLQDAVDNAALAGATVYNASAQSSNAISVATKYINNAPLPAAITMSTPTVTAATGTTNFSAAAYNVTVTATATYAPPFLSMIKSAFTMSATATASNPIVTISFNSSSWGSSAADWDSVWLYAVPMSNGQPVYSSIPSQSSWYEIGSNCNKTNSNYSTSSRCYGQTGATVSSSQTMPTLTATQPIGFVLQNMTYGMYSSSTTGTNGYGAEAGHTNLFYSAYEEISASPSENANYTYTTSTTSRGRTTTTSTTTTYPTSSSTLPNCSLLVEQVTTSSTPTSPPSSGKCFSLTNTASGYPYASMSCASINGNTYMYWWNDMGGGSDDKDYNDAYYTITCSVSGGSGTGNTQVVLTK